MDGTPEKNLEKIRKQLLCLWGREAVFYEWGRFLSQKCVFYKYFLNYSEFL